MSLLPTWLNDAVFYEIYPQSFYDSNGDGIGDLPGITEKLPYVKNLGCNAIWLNPIYDSPFLDGGYDVRDHKRVAARYGTNEDLLRLFEEAHKLGLRVLLDLVPGHTSDTHAWFQAAKKAEKNEHSNRYIFTNSVWDAPGEYRMNCGLCERDGNYLVNFFSSQPALNYGFHEITHPDWQLPCDHPDPLATVEAIRDIMRFWLDLGADGFRVDMADSLVKNDDEKIATAKIWRGIREMLDAEYPEAALVAEWCNPERAIKNAGFHMDFYLDHKGNGYNLLFRAGDGAEAVFNPKATDAAVSAGLKGFLDEYLPAYALTKNLGYISFMTNNHDMPRILSYLDQPAIRLVNAFLFTMPGVPFLYYGDEIGMRYQNNLISKEGGYGRTGSRTPMQWNSLCNLGFSTSQSLYLPVDSAADAPTVENQLSEPDSLYHLVTELIALRHSLEDLHGNGAFTWLSFPESSRVFAYQRGSLVMYFNVSGTEITVKAPYVGKSVYQIGAPAFAGASLILPAQSFLMIQTNEGA